MSKPIKDVFHENWHAGGEWRRGNWRNVAVAIVFILGTVLGGFVGAWVENHHQSDALLSGSLTNQKRVITSESRLISQIAKTLGPSVVSVNVDITSAAASPNTLDLFGFSQQPSQEQAAGTGIIISSNGLILTNRHVVPVGTTNVSVTLSDGTELKDVSVVGRTNENDSLDVAILKINDAKGHQLTPAPLGDSTTAQVGDNVVAIGNALGEFQNTVTSGIVSGFGRTVQAGDGTDTSSVEDLNDLIQTDAAINEGNSGGPLVNLNGQVIGLNTAIAGNGAQNIGFAIPINDVKGIITHVLKTGQFARAYLGIHYVSLDADVATQYGLKTTSGAYIIPSTDQNSSSVVSGGPADKAGLKERDIITAVNDTVINQEHSLTGLLGAYQPGDKVTLTVLRGSDTLHVTATLGTLPSASQ